LKIIPQVELEKKLLKGVCTDTFKDNDARKNVGESSAKLGFGGSEGAEVEGKAVGEAVEGLAEVEGLIVVEGAVEGTEAADDETGGSKMTPNWVRCVVMTVACDELTDAIVHPSVFHIKRTISQ